MHTHRWSYHDSVVFGRNGTDGCLVASLVDIEKRLIWVGLIDSGTEEWLVDKWLDVTGEMLMNSIQPDKLRRMTELRDFMSSQAGRSKKKCYRLRQRSRWRKYVYACEVGNRADNTGYHRP